ASTLVTRPAALGGGDFAAGATRPGPAMLDPPQTDAGLPNADRQSCGPNDEVTLAVAMQNSCNTAFGWLGMELGGDAVREQSSKFGFGGDLEIPMDVAPSSIPSDLNPPQEAPAAAGQHDVRVTPPQLAMVSAARAPGGVVVKPRLSQSVLGSDLSTIEETEPERLSKAMEEDTSDQLTEMMELVVTDGTGQQGAVDGVSVAAKTGTAEHAEG